MATCGTSTSSAETWQKLENYSSTPTASTLISSINVANGGGRLTGKNGPLVPVAPVDVAALKTLGAARGRGADSPRSSPSIRRGGDGQVCVGSAMALRSR